MIYVPEADKVMGAGVRGRKGDHGVAFSCSPHPCGPASSTLWLLGAPSAPRTLFLECLMDTPHCAPNWIRFSPVHTHSTLLLVGYCVFRWAALESSSGSGQDQFVTRLPLGPFQGSHQILLCFFPSSQLYSPCI